MEKVSQQIIWGLLRIALGFIFLWEFLDKLFGLGYSTERGKAWLDGVSPTAEFLKYETKGMFGQYFSILSGNKLVDWLYMLGLLFIGVALMSGTTVKLASLSGMMMMTLLYIALAPSPTNPIVDEHVIYFFVFLTFLVTSHRFLSLNSWWTSLPFIKNIKILH